MRKLGVLIAAALAAQGCREGQDTSAVSHRTAGDTTFISSPAIGTEGPVTLQELTRFSTTSADLGRVVGGAFGANGTIWLFDAAGRDGARIIVLDSLGRLHARAGREGGGPGEYRSPVGIFQLADRSMLAKEMRTTRAIRFDADGNVLATLTLPPEVASGWVVTPDTESGWFITALFEPNTPTRVGRFGWFHFDSMGVVKDTIHPPAPMLTEPTPDGIAPGRIRTVGRDGSVLTTEPGPNRVTRFAPDGTVQVFEWPGLPPEYRTDEREEMQAVADRLSELLGKPKRALPQRKQPAHRIHTDNAGVIWVQLSTPGERIPDELLPKNNDPLQIKWRDLDRWAAFAPDGALRFVVDLPATYRVLDRHDSRLLGIAADDDGEEHVVILQIVTGAN